MARHYERVAAAIEFLEQNRSQKTSLGEVASAVGLSEHHFQRLFTRWVGISPKQFAQYLTIDQARRLLRESTSLLEAAYEVGLSGPGRLHDLFVTIDAVTPGEFKRRGAGLRIDFGEHDSPFGRCLIGETSRGICWLSFADGVDNGSGLTQLRATWPWAELRHDATATAPTADRIFALRAAADRRPLRLLVGGTNFQVKVWEALIRIPPGRLVSYGDIARAVGTPRATRAVGNAVAANAIAYLIPCHRVIRSVGTAGAYRWGHSRKMALIGWEAARRSLVSDGDAAVSTSAP